MDNKKWETQQELHRHNDACAHEACGCEHHGHNHEACHCHDHDEDEVQDIDSYFREKNPRVAFIELKEQAEAAPSSLVGIPLPIRLCDFMEGLQEHFDREIPVRAILNGMVWMLAIDPAFRYTDDYKKFLQEAVKDPTGYALQLGMGHLKRAYTLQQEITDASTSVEPSDKVQEAVDKEWEAALLSFRGAYILHPDEPLAAVEYARLLWREGQQSIFLEEANHILEQVLEKDEENVAANTALGDLHEQMGQYLKATAYYSHALEHCNDETVKQELRESMTRIAPDAAIENGIYYLRRADYPHALEALMKAKAESNRYDTDYYLGVAYQNMSHFDAAVEAFRASLDKGGDFEDVYNGLVYALNADGKIDEALEAATEGLKQHPDALRLLFNRAVLYAQTGDNDAAEEDLKEILSFDDLSDEFFNEVMRLREQVLGTSQDPVEGASEE